MGKAVERKSNYELLRIVSMLFIVLYHTIFHGQVLNNCQNPKLLLFFQIIEFLVIVHVNSYILVTGYFQCDKPFKQSKVWSIVNAALFYFIIMATIFLGFGIVEMEKVDVINTFFSEYWFIKVYIFLYCLSPFLNKLIQILDKADYQKLLIASFVLFSIIPYITSNRLFDNGGYSLYNFIYLYFIGAYFRKYKIIEEKIISNPFKRKLQVLLVALFLLFGFTNFFCYKVSFAISEIHPLINGTFGFSRIMSLAYSNPFIIIQTVVFFLFFATLDFRSKIINRLSRYTLEVYLIHDSCFVRQTIYKWLGIQREMITSYRFILYVFVVVAGIYLSCSLLGMIRQTVFQFFYKRKVSTRIRERYYLKVNQLKNKMALF